MKAVALWLAPEWMEIEAGDVEIAQRLRMFERVKPPERPASEFRRHLATSTLPKELLKPLVPETPNHRPSVTSLITPVKEYFTEMVFLRWRICSQRPQLPVLRRARDACKR